MALGRSLLRTALLLGVSLLACPSAAQDFGGSGRDEDAFSYVQPLNTTILGPYGHSPAVLPSPNSTGIGGWEAAIEKARTFVAQMTLEEKADMVTGVAGPCVGNIVAIPRLGFSGLCLQDGPLAIRVADYASVFSAGVSAAATWDRSLLYERGFALGQEFRGKGAHIALMPVAGPLGRSGYGGRNWEGFAADPYLSGVAMEETIKGVQDTGVQATAKHYIANEQEIMRNPVHSVNKTVTDVDFEALSANLDDRTMHELYLWPFANAVKAGVASVMCAYQRINGSYACENSKAQNGLLKRELGFQGYIMSDWGGTHSGVSSIEGGLDMNMPGGLGPYGTVRTPGPDGISVSSFFGGNVTLAVNNGTVDMSRVDDMVIRIMTPYYFLGQDRDFPPVDPAGAELNTFSPISLWSREFNLTGSRSVDVRGNHAELIRRHGAAGHVLVKNENKALPLKKPRTIAVFGNDAAEPTEGQYLQDDYEYGTIVAGGGSGTGRLSNLVTPLEALKARARQDGTNLQYFLNNTIIATSRMPAIWNPGMPDVCIVMLKTWAQEGEDRTTLRVNWRGEEVVASVARYCNNTVVVSHSPGINLLPFADNPNVTAILAAHFPGEESGNSLVDVLYGAYNPSGKLPYTIAFNGSDYNAPPTTAINTTGVYDWQSWFDERLEIDYRYFDAHNISVRYEFGFGLSYTTFSVSDIAARPLHGRSGAFSAEPDQRDILPGGNPALWENLYNVTVTVTNTGDVEGHAIPQLYVTFPQDMVATGTPPRQLRGFDKVMLAAGESHTVSFGLMRRDLSYWDVVSQQWLIPRGEFTLNVGFSSRDLAQFATITPVSG